ncbi:MAG: PAS domain S-box protein [candidate division Zixibacteria bacterium]|nr:PAS domain S-box protein [candidate division Zixibacteria bacterium]
MQIRDQKKSYQENRKDLNLCSALVRLSSLALSQADPDRIVSQALKDIRKILDAKLCWLFLVEDNKIKFKSLGETRSTQNLIKSQLLPKLSPEILKRTYPIICNRIGELYKNNRALYKFLNGKRIHKFMGVPLKKDGKLIGALNLARDAASPDFTPEDLKSLTFLGNMIVMTKLRRTEEDSKKSQDFLEAIIDNIPNPIFIKDRKHRYMVLNKVVTDLTGYSREKMLGKSDYDFFPKEQAGFFWKKDEQMFRTGKVIDIPEEPITDKEGKIHYIHTKKAPLKDSSGRTTHLVGIIEDITERKRAESALRESKEKYRLLVENIKEGIYSTHKGVFTSVNESMSRMFGYSRKELIGMPSWNLAVPEMRNSVKDMFFERFAKKDYSPIEVKCMRKDGSVFIAEIRVSGISEKQQFLGIVSDITDRKQAEEALQISQERYELSTKAANVGVWDWDIKTNKFYIDPTVKEILGYKDEEIPNDIEVWMTYVHPDDREPVMAAAQTCLDGKTPEYVFEHRMVHRDGSVRWILSRGNVMRDAKGNAVRMVGTDTDITERKRAEEALQASENKYRTLLENLPQKIFLKERNSVYVSCNESYARDLKIKSDEIAGKTDYDFFPKELAEKYRADDKRIMELGKTEDVEERYIQERQEVFVHTVKTPVKDEQGNLIGLLGIFWDITERKRAEEALQRSERKYRTLVETAQEGIGIADPKENLIFINQAFADLLGYKKEELFGKNLKEICDETQYVMLKKETQKRKKGESSKYEAKLLTKRGKPKYFYVSAAPLWNEDGSFMGTLAVLSDLTEIKKAREYNVLLDTSRELSRTLRLDQLLKIGAEKMIQVLNADRCAVLLIEDDTVGSMIAVQVYAQKTKVLAPPLKLKITEELFSSYKQSLLTQGYIQISDPRTDRLPELGRKILRKTGMISSLIIPMFLGKKMLGAFHVGMTKKSKIFSEEEVRLIRTMANQVAVALQNCRLMENLKKEHSRITEQAEVLKRQTREKDILLKVSRALSKTMDLDEVSKVASRVMGSAMGAERCAVTLATPDGNQLEIKGLFSKEQTDAHKLIGTKFLWGDIPAMTKAIKKGKPFVINDTTDIPSKGKTRDYFLKVGIKSVLGAGMFFGKKLVGILSITTTKERKTFSREEVKLVQTMANQIAVAIENARLLQVVKKHTQDLKDLSSQLMKVQEKERKRIAQELHDEVGQMLQSMKMNLDRIKMNLRSKPQRLDGIEDWLLDTEKLLGQTIDDIRTLTFDLRPSMLDDFGLIPTLRWFIENYRKRSNIKVSLKAKDPKYRFPAEVEVTLYRIIQEALTNVAKHAKATEASVMVSQKNSTVILSVRDNGVGFDASKVLSAPRGMGLLNIKERVNLLGGSFEIISRPRKGTRVNINIPF